MKVADLLNRKKRGVYFAIFGFFLAFHKSENASNAKFPRSETLH